MKRRKLATVAAAIIASFALIVGASNAGFAASSKPVKLDKSYKTYEPFPQECLSGYTDPCLIPY